MVLEFSLFANNVFKSCWQCYERRLHIYLQTTILQTSFFLKLKNNTERGMTLACVSVTFKVISAAVNDKQLVMDHPLRCLLITFYFFLRELGTLMMRIYTHVFV